LDRCRLVLEALADPQRIIHIGGNGAGYPAKLLVNLLWFGQAVATGEALLLAREPLRKSAQCSPTRVTMCDRIGRAARDEVSPGQGG
jgi:hypothetical protein